MATIKRTGPLSRTAVQVYAALAMHMAPKLALDAELDLTPILKDVTAKNLKSKAKAIWKGACDLGTPMLDPAAAAGGGFGPDDVIMKVLEMVGSEVASDPAQLDAAPVDPAAAAMPGAVDPAAAIAPPDPAAAAVAPPAAAEGGGTGPDAVMEFLQTKLGPEDLAAVAKLLGGAEEEEDPIEEEVPVGAKDKLEPMISKTAMDAALVANGKTVEANVMARMRAVQEARTAVKPWVGELSMAYDSAEDVHRAAAKALGIKVDGKHPDALLDIIQAQPRPGDRPQNDNSGLALDAAQEKSLADRFPHAAKIRNL